MSYEYDVFVSYKRDGAVDKWVHNHFLPQLEEWLTATVQGGTRCFIDTRMETGVTWPLELERALCRSAILVAVYSPNYFISRWCRAEIQSMIARERHLSLRTPDDTDGLIFPVLFNDGEDIPDELSHIQYRDFRPWHYEMPSFRDSTRYMDFIDGVERLAQEIAHRLTSIPPWDAKWPIVRPRARARPRIPLARLVTR